ncbi:hypothetical protein D770_10885 [Flammeovirgaceae bacterium 311]|nr:hypothetical protein D770_10885 [Flammeovirgaceae bacterium 311]
MKEFQLSIPRPCSEEWNNMTPTGKGAYCSSCRKEVVDFTAMSDREIREFFNRPKEPVCGRFREVQLEQPYGYVAAVPVWKKWLIAAMVGIGVPGLAFSQQTKPLTQQHPHKTTDSGQQLLRLERIKPGESLISKLKGSVLDAETGIPMAGVVVSDGANTLAVTDQQGDFELLYQDLISVNALKFESLGYDSLTLVKSSWKEVLIVEMAPSVCAMAQDIRGTVTVTAGMVAVHIKQQTFPEKLWWKIRKMVNSN